ncbi:hypothetical protein [uncultured Thomasclavelia sp.]|uniref:hypothetical protein n=1 Tax=uncultured Thomasclavelia sp. TaxID=3025759 RepID=UPI0025FD570F|nr:hypothetical protein [uncultured Thomasclavelia sp.]
MKSLKELVESKEIELVDHDLIYKLIAVMIMLGLLLISLVICFDGFNKIPVIGSGLNAVLNLINEIMAFLANLIRNILQVITN